MQPLSRLFYYVGNRLLDHQIDRRLAGKRLQIDRQQSK